MWDQKKNPNHVSGQFSATLNISLREKVITKIFYQREIYDQTWIGQFCHCKIVIMSVNSWTVRNPANPPTVIIVYLVWGWMPSISGWPRMGVCPLLPNQLESCLAQFRHRNQLGHTLAQKQVGTYFLRAQFHILITGCHFTYFHLSALQLCCPIFCSSQTQIFCSR